MNLTQYKKLRKDEVVGKELELAIELFVTHFVKPAVLNKRHATWHKAKWKQIDLFATQGGAQCLR